MSLLQQYALAVAIGAGATAAIDLWNYALRRGAGIPSLNYCLLGRWVGHMPNGVFRHRSIALARRTPFECAIGWTSHYLIGIALAVMFVAGAGGEWLATPTLLPALGFGLLTVIFPFLVLQPALGLGIASAAAPHPLTARIKSLVTHTVYGLGLYACARVAAALVLP